jgi:hypothetical protein
MGTATTPGEVTVTPIYWEPTGMNQNLLPVKVSGLTNSFLSNLAADSGKTSNALAVVNQYTGSTNYGAATPAKPLRWAVHAGQAIIDSTAFPANGCTVDGGSVYADKKSYSRCLSDSQLAAELRSVVKVNSLPTDASHLYSIFTPEGVEVCFDSANSACTLSNSNRSGQFCAYHTNDQGSTNPSTLLYSVEPYPIYDSATGYACNGADQFPLGVPAADVGISTFSHEIAEAVTDPYGTAWIDSAGNEIGDLCSFNYGPLLSLTPGAAVSQRINGTGYYIQGEFSNATFALDPTRGCVSVWGLPAAHINGLNSFTVNKAASFTSRSTSTSSALVSQVWSIGSRVLGTSSSLTIHFAVPGTRVLTLTVTDAAGYQSVVSRTLTITR